MNKWFKLVVPTLLIVVVILSSCQQKEKYTYAAIETSLGTMKVMLYNSTPKHRDNFIKLANEGFYDGLLFHRVIPGFMIQGGDPDSKVAPAGARLGGGGPGYMIDAEIGSPHIKGALAAARTGFQNPEKRSSGSQFYIVDGMEVNDNMLDMMQRQKKITYNEAQRSLYKEIGGRPDLDMEYTVFGEIVEGLDVVAAIANVERDGADRPIQDLKMTVRIVE